MAAGDKVQIGRAFKVEFGAFTWAGYMPDSVANQRTADLSTQKDQRGADCTYIFDNPGKQLTLNLRIEDTGSITPFSPGDIVEVTPPEGTSAKWIILSATPINHSSGVATTTVTLDRKDSMAATLDA